MDYISNSLKILLCKLCSALHAPLHTFISPKNFLCKGLLATPPACYRGLPECLRECPRKLGCLRECPTECHRGPLGPQPPEGPTLKCPESVPRVSGTAFRHSRDTLGTLFGHSGGPRPKGPGDTPWDTPGENPSFRGPLSGTLPETLRARRARETPVAGRGGRNVLFVKIIAKIIRKKYFSVSVSDME